MKPEDLKWEGNSKAMYERFVLNVPGPFKKKAMKDFLNYIEREKVTVMTEDIFIKSTEENAPKMFRGMIMKQVNEMRSS